MGEMVGRFLPDGREVLGRGRPKICGVIAENVAFREYDPPNALGTVHNFDGKLFQLTF